VTDRDFAEVLVERARQEIDKALRDLRPPASHDGRMAPHVALEKLAKLEIFAENLNAIANLAKVERR